MKAFCSKCGLPLGFKQLESGKWRPTNADGTDHYDICRLTQFVNAKQNVCVGMATTKTVPTAKNWPEILALSNSDERLPWDESIEFDSSWIRDYKIVKDPNAYRKFVDPSKLLELRGHK